MKSSRTQQRKWKKHKKKKHQRNICIWLHFHRPIFIFVVVVVEQQRNQMSFHVILRFLFHLTCHSFQRSQVYLFCIRWRGHFAARETHLMQKCCFPYKFSLIAIKKEEEEENLSAQHTRTEWESTHWRPIKFTSSKSWICIHARLSLCILFPLSPSFYLSRLAFSLFHVQDIILFFYRENGKLVCKVQTIGTCKFKPPDQNYRTTGFRIQRLAFWTIWTKWTIMFDLWGRVIKRIQINWTFTSPNSTVTTNWRTGTYKNILKYIYTYIYYILIFLNQLKNLNL